MVLDNAITWLTSQGNLFFLVVITAWIAIGDVRTRRIPNYLTLGIALAGLGYQAGFQGWSGLAGGLLGMGLGFGLMILPYILGGMGAGDVKALAALGAWLGPLQTFMLFCYMALAGGVMAFGVLWWKGLLWHKIRQAWVFLVNWLLNRPFKNMKSSPTLKFEIEGIPYGVAIALGMTALYLKVMVYGQAA